MGMTSVELLIDISPMKKSYSENVITYSYTDTLSANEINNLASRHPSEAFLFFRSCSHHVAIGTVICTA